LDPKDSAGFNSLGWLLSTCPGEALRDGRRALEAAQKACELTSWNKHGYVDTFAAALAETGAFDEAVKFQSQAMDLTDSADPECVGMEQRLALYAKHMPYRQEAAPSSGDSIMASATPAH
jgi:hypothetical protein